MFRTFASFALACLSLFASYAIVAEWPDGVVPSRSAIAAVAPVGALAAGGVPVTAQAAPTIVGLAD